MPNACTPILMGMASPVLEIPLLSKTAKFPFRTMDYSPWSAKNLINQNQLKKFMQVGIDVTFIDTNLMGVAFLVLEILLHSKTTNFPFRTMDNSPWSAKI